MLTPTCLPDLDYIFEPTLIFMPINLEHEPFILESHTTMWGKECEPLLFDLDPPLELKLTLKPKLDLSHIPKFVLIPSPFTLESKSTISPNHTLCWVRVVNNIT